MVKSITNKNNFNIKNVQNNNTITSDIKTGQIIATNATITTATITNLNNSQVSTNTSNISTNAANITTLQTTTATNTADIATNTSNISTNATDISTNASNISTNTANISTNASNISTNTANIATNTSNISTNTADIATNTSNISTNTANITQNSTDITTLQTNKQDTITDTTDIELNDLTINDTLFFQKNNSTDTKTNITRSTTDGKMRFNAESYTFKDENNSTNLFTISDAGTINCTTVEADTITLNGSDLQGKLDDKADNFSVNLPLELDNLAIPNAALKLNYNTTEFELDTNDELKLTGSLPTLTSALNCGVNNVSGITSLSCRSIELHNSTSGNSFLDFGGGDFRFRQLYNQTQNTFTFTIDDAAGENPESKLVITRTEVKIENADLDLNNQDLIGTKYIQGDNSIKIYTNGETTAGSNYSMDLKDDGNIDFNNNSLLNVEEVQNAVKFVEFGGSPNSATNNLWGNDNIHDVWADGVNVNASGMISEASGVFTINEAGTYTIDCNSSIEDVNFNGRLVCAQYISVNDDTTRFRLNPSSFAITYIRDDGFGFGGSLSFSTTIILSQNDTIRFKSKLGKNTDNRAYDDTHSDTGLNWWCGVRFTKHLIA